MTSNIGSPDLLEGVTAEGEILTGTRERVLGQLRAQFRPEFLNRVDEIVLFKPLTRKEIREIVDLLVRELSERLINRGLHLVVAGEVIDLVVERGYDPTLGARPLKRYIQREVETPVARALVEQSPEDGSTIVVKVSGDSIQVALEPFVGHPSAAA